MAYDLIGFGESMIRLAPPAFHRLEQARSLDLKIGGAELNTAVGIARLGRKSTWVSRLTDNSLGRLVTNHAREAGSIPAMFCLRQMIGSASIFLSLAPPQGLRASCTTAKIPPLPPSNRE